MIIEFGNETAHRGIDDRPKVTTMHIPEFDEHGLGGYTHEPGLSPKDFADHLMEAMLHNDGITHLPEHEALISVVAAMPRHMRGRPSWVNVIPAGGEAIHEVGEDGRVKLDAAGKPVLTKQMRGATPKGHVDDLHAFFEEHFSGGPDNHKCLVGRPENHQETHWTLEGPPGVYIAQKLPNARALFTNDGRVQQGTNFGGGIVGTSGTASATAVGSLTTAAIGSVVANVYAGYRIYTPTAWANIQSHTSGTTPVFTIDRWYNYATPGGAAATTPGSTTTWVIPDGGNVSGWFVGLTTTNITPAAADHSMTGEYVTAGGGFLRKIAPYALTSGTSPLGWTLTPVLTGNGSDTYPSTFYAAGYFVSMVVAATTLTMKFETSLNASATVAASGDQVTVTEAGAGS